METKRAIWVDCVAGLLIVRMILGHYVSYSGLKDSVLFSSLNVLYFYMPWFFFKSGMFYRPIEKGEWKRLVKKKARTLLVPFVLFSLLGILTGYIYYRTTNDVNYAINFSSICSNFIGMGAYYWSSHLWFLLTLFVVCIITPILLRYVNEWFIALLSVMIAFSHYLYFWGGHLIGLGILAQAFFSI